MSNLEEFNKICDFRIFPRKTNYLSNKVEREDSLFTYLAVIYFSHPCSFNKLKTRIPRLLKHEEREVIFALAGYIYYIGNDFKKAKFYFLKAISLNPDNLDNWMDLAFALRHNGEDSISKAILFNYNHVIYCYKYFKLKGCSYSKLKKVIGAISKSISKKKSS